MSAYRYNGARLPALPEWDAVTYPYAHIQYIPYRDGSFIAHLRCSDRPFRKAAGVVTVASDAVMLVRSFTGTGAEYAWGNAYAVMIPSLALKADTVIWCNSDISDDSGAVFLAASQPAAVQAVSIPNFCMYSWITGFTTGLAGRPMGSVPTGAGGAARSVEPAWLLQGWFMGRRLAGTRQPELR